MLRLTPEFYPTLNVAMNGQFENQNIQQATTTQITENILEESTLEEQNEISENNVNF